VLIVISGYLAAWSWLGNRFMFCLDVHFDYSNWPPKAALRGKSGLHRVECQVTSGGREPTESAAENKPPAIYSR